MGNCFTKTYEHEIPITEEPPPPRRPWSQPQYRPPHEHKTRDVPLSSGTGSRRAQTLPRPRPPPSRPAFPSSGAGSMMGRRASSGGEVGPVLQRPMVDVRTLFHLERKLGSKQFGTTYLCTERATGLKYVCKSVSKRKLVRRAGV